MPSTWPPIVGALEQLGASASVARPGLYGRVLRRLLAAEPRPPQRPGREPDDAEHGAGASSPTPDLVADQAPAGRR